MARPEAAQGNFATLISRPSFCAWVSVSPHHAISGSVNTTAGNSIWLEGDFVPGNRFDRSTALMRRFMGKHGLAHHIANRVDDRIVGLQLFVHLDKSALPELHLSLIKAGDFRIRFASNGNEHPIKYLLSLFDFRAIERSPECLLLPLSLR